MRHQRGLRQAGYDLPDEVSFAVFGIEVGKYGDAYPRSDTAGEV